MSQVNLICFCKVPNFILELVTEFAKRLILSGFYNEVLVNI